MTINNHIRKLAGLGIRQSIWKQIYQDIMREYRILKKICATPFCGFIKERRRKIVILLSSAVSLLILIPALILLVIGLIGKNSLFHSWRDRPPVLSVLDETEESKSGILEYKGQLYEYNDDILSFLFMGIDKDGVAQSVSEMADGGQADALFLLVFNPREKDVKIIGINRNAMVDVNIYNEKGTWLSSAQAQIALQHGFGDGLNQSCTYQTETVRELFYQLPIHGYCSLNMDAMIVLTDLVGGIELTAIEDVTSAIQDDTLGDYVIGEGETAVLTGRDAYSYIRYRKEEAEGSANLRLDRQKQFLGAFLDKVKSLSVQNLTFPMQLYNAASPYMVTDITFDEIVYLSALALRSDFDIDRIYALEGETVQGKDFEEFYVDEKALYEMILDLFYIPVGE